MQVTLISSIADIDAAQWNALTGAHIPYLRHEFLLALEASDCVAAATGWLPKHCLFYDADGCLFAAAPQYIKQHSYGEYVFDWAWADAYHRAGLSYYPKLVNAIPFTPSSSPRLLVSERALATFGGEIWQTLGQAYLKEAQFWCKELSLSSVHVLFPPNEEHNAVMYQHWLEREQCQYHWHNKGYEHFDDFLAGLSSSRRKNIRKERKRLHEKGLHYDWVKAGTLSSEQRELFFRCYEATYHERGQLPYLNRAFFAQIFDTLPDQVHLVFAYDAANHVIASALYLCDLDSDDTLYGRYWGCLHSYDFLHFELCYYQGIEFCITHGIKRFDAGAQGEQKLLRGFEPVKTISYHYLEHEPFRHAVSNFLEEEREHIERYREDALRWLPYKKQ